MWQSLKLRFGDNSTALARNVPTIINLLDASHPTKRSPICIYVLHLVELTGRASAMLIVHNTRKSGRPLTAISPYSTMHEDICNLAEDKRVAFIIIPFHKQQTVDGGMEASNPAFRLVNQNVLANAPCSVGILVDRGLNGANRATSNKGTHYNIIVLFFGGQDDREALSYAWRMSEHPGVNLTVMRFIAAQEIMEPKTEKVLNNGEETVAAIRSMNDAHDLFIVGRGESHISPLTAGLTDWSECPELGAIGDLLASSDFAATTSVLVVQQFGTTMAGEHGEEEEVTPRNLDPNDPYQSLRSTNLRQHTPSRTQIIYDT